MAGSFKAVLFDLDGTLLDTHELILASFRHSMDEVLGASFPEEELMKKVGQPLETQMWDFTDDPAVHERLLTVYRNYNHEVHDECVRAFDGVSSMLADVRERGLRVGVVTSKRHALAQRGLEVCGLADYVECLVGPDDFPAHKPDPGPVAYGCELLGCAPSECLYVGDSPFDTQAGNGAGCTTVAVCWGMFSPEVLAASSPSHTIEKPEELAALLDEACA